MNSFQDTIGINMRVVQILRSIVSYILSVPLCIIIVLPCLLVLVVAPQRYMTQRGIVFWMLDLVYRGSMLIMLMPKKWYGVHHIPDEPAVIIANHQSSLDIPVVGALLQRAPHLWYALAYYARHPFFGVFLGRLGISVDLQKPGASAKSLLQGVRLLHDDPRHVVIFPEGGRYTDRSVHQFYRGFAVIARKTGRPVVPIYMPNNGAIYGPQSYLTEYHTIIAQVGETFYVHEDETDEDFTARVREWFVQQADTWT